MTNICRCGVNISVAEVLYMVQLLICYRAILFSQLLVCPICKEGYICSAVV